MTQDEIIRMAQESDMDLSMGVAWADFNTLERFAALVAAHEREKQGGLVEIIEQLWNIIDDIDTCGDMVKADDKLFRGLVERRQKDRWKTGITTDGYTLTIPDVAVSVEAAVLAEREACAKVCENLPTPKDATTLTHIPTLETCAAAIRARSN